MAPMMASTVYSDDDDSVGSIHTDPSQASRGSSVGRSPEYSKYLGTQVMCGASFIPHTNRGQTFVCFQIAHQCRRQNHKSAERQATYGDYYAMETSTKGFRDGVLSSGITEASYGEMLALQAAADEDALEGFGTRTESDAALYSQQSADGVAGQSSWTKTLGLTGVKDMIYGEDRTTPVPASSKKPSSTRGYRPTNVSFSSPVMTSSRGPGKPSPESSEDTGKNLQIWELERQLAQLRGPTPTGKAKSKSGTKGTPILDFLQPTPKPSKVKNQQSRKPKPVPFPAPSGYESEDSLAPHPVAPAPTKYWYGIAFGKYNRSGVFEDKAEVRSLIQDGTKYIRGQNPEEVWDFVHFHTSEGPGAHYPGYGIPTPPAAPQVAPPRIPPVPAALQTPQQQLGPPLLLHNKDKSTKIKEEIFGISLDVDSQELRQHLAPPGMADERAIPLMECLVDAVSLPGKTNSSGENDDAGSNLHSALVELVATTNQLRGQEDMSRDLKWKNQSRHALKGVKTESQLIESLKDVSELRDRTIRNLNARQRTILGKEAWNPLVIAAWSDNGFISVISRRSVDHYISLLQHLVLVSGSYGWEETQRQIDHYTKEWVLIRSQSASRLMALCHIYVALRDGHDALWLSPILEAEKVTALFLEVAQLKSGGTGGGRGAGGTVCGHCHIGIHGSHPCTWGSSTPAEARKKGAALLRKLASNGVREEAAAAGAAGQG